MSAPCRAVVFDLDGTLIDSAPDIAASLNRTLAREGLPALSVASVAAMVGDGAVVLAQRAFAALGQPDDAARDAAVARAYLADYLDNAVVETRAYPGVAATLEKFAAEGWRMAVCTNKPQAVARKILGRLGLVERFAAIGGGDSFPVRKPDPQHLASTMRAAGLGEAGNGRAVMVGDHANDVLAARGCGIASVWASWGYADHDPGADAAAPDFRALPGIVARLLQAPAAEP